MTTGERRERHMLQALHRPMAVALIKIHHQPTAPMRNRPRHHPSRRTQLPLMRQPIGPTPRTTRIVRGMPTTATMVHTVKTSGKLATGTQWNQ